MRPYGEGSFANTLSRSYQEQGYDNNSYAGGPSNPLVAALQLFFELRDRKYLGIVEDLFTLYEFHHIAEGIAHKYSTLPYGWKAELTHLKENYPNTVPWLNMKKMIWYSETTDTYPGVNKKLEFPQRAPHQEPEKVVDEFIENERSYFEKLQAFMKSYVCEVEAIVENKLGRRASQALGLDRAQVRYVFGPELHNVYKAVEGLLVSLETLTLVSSLPKTPGGRAAHLCEILQRDGQRLVDSYGPYNARYQMAKRVIEKQSEHLVESRLAEGEVVRHLNFKELWHEISQSNSELKNLGIDSVLIMPIRRFPNYKLFIDRLRKTLKPNHAAYSQVDACLHFVDGLTRQIDDAVSGI